MTDSEVWSCIKVLGSEGAASLSKLAERRVPGVLEYNSFLF